MSQINSPGPRGRPSFDNDIYTVLMLVAFLSMLIAVGFVVYKSISLFGTVLPPVTG